MAKLANKTKKPALAHLDTEHLSVRAIDISVYVMTSLKWRLGAFPWNIGLSHSSAPHAFLPLASPMGPSSPTKRQTELHYS